MDLALNIALLLLLEYPDDLKIIELIDKEEKGERVTHEDILAQVDPKAAEYFHQQYQSIIADTSKFDQFVNSFKLLSFDGNIFDLFKGKFLVACDNRLFEKLSVVPDKKPSTDHFDVKYQKVYESNSLYPLYLFYQGYASFQQHVHKEMKKHHDQSEYKITNEHYLDENYDAIQSISKDNKKLRFLYMNNEQKAIHYMLNHEFDKSLALIKTKNNLYYHILFENLYNKKDLKNLKLIFDKYRALQEEDVELKRFKLFFLAQNYTKCNEIFKSFQTKNNVLEAMMCFERIKFLLYLKDYTCINEIQRAKQKYTAHKLFYHRFCILEQIYHIELCQQTKIVRSQNLEDSELWLMENGYKDDQEILERMNQVK